MLIAIYERAVNSGLSKNDVSTLETKIIQDLNISISNYIPENHPIWAGRMPEWASTVTIHQLLVHSSGIVNVTSLPEYKDVYENPPNISTLIGYFKDKELDFKSGLKYSYSNTGYILLGELLVQLTGETLDVYMNRVLFEPLKMDSTFLATKGTVNDLKSDSRFKRLARGYEFDITAENPIPMEVKRYEQMQIPKGAGGLVSTVLDLMKWNNALYTGKAIPEFLLKMMLTPHISTGYKNIHYGYGIGVIQSKQLGIYYSHGGDMTGYGSNLVYIPSLQLSIICLTNVLANEDNLEQEIQNIKAHLQIGISETEVSDKIEEELNKKCPDVIKNRDQYAATQFVNELINGLSG
jgi:CubicO group peptidase (beta-lactamase class C family)